MRFSIVLVTVLILRLSLSNEGFAQANEKQLRVFAAVMFQTGTANSFSGIGPAAGLDYDVFYPKGLMHGKIKYQYLNTNSIEGRDFHDYIGSTFKVQANYLFLLKIKSTPFYAGPGLAFHQTLTSTEDNGPDFGLNARAFHPTLVFWDRLNAFYDFDWICTTGILRNTIGISYSIHNWK